MRFLLLLLSIVFLSSAQSNLFPSDSLTSPWKMEHLPDTISDWGLILNKPYAKSGMETNYLSNGYVYGNGYVVGVRIYNCGSDSMAGEYYKHVYSPNVSSFPDSTLYDATPDTMILFKPCRNYVIHISTEGAQICRDEARTIELLIIDNIKATTLVKHCLLSKKLHKELGINGIYLVNGRNIGKTSSLFKLRLHQFIIHTNK